MFWQILCIHVHAVDLFIIWVSILVEVAFIASHLLVLFFIVVFVLIVFLLVVALRARVGSIGLIIPFILIGLLLLLVEKLHEGIYETSGVECGAIDDLVNDDFSVFELVMMFALDFVVAELSEEDELWV